MPELPEVETTLRGILPHIKRQTIANIIVRQPRLRWPVAPNLQQILLGQTITDVQRRAKYLLLSVDSGTIIIHLGMSGHLRILLNPVAPKKHDHIDILFHNDKVLRFTDPRRFGAFLWTQNDPHQHPLLKNLGVEPLTKDFSGKYLWAKARDRTMPIKSLLMDNKIVTGIGNIYATEALFMARIHPLVPAHIISLEQSSQLTLAIKDILQQAIKRGGTTLKDFIGSDGKPGYFSNQLKVYGRARLPCVICDTILQSIQIGQRNTAYCKHCQS